MRSQAPARPAPCRGSGALSVGLLGQLHSPLRTQQPRGSAPRPPRAGGPSGEREAARFPSALLSLLFPEVNQAIRNHFPHFPEDPNTSTSAAASASLSPPSPALPVGIGHERPPNTHRLPLVETHVLPKAPSRTHSPGAAGGGGILGVDVACPCQIPSSLAMPVPNPQLPGNAGGTGIEGRNWRE